MLGQLKSILASVGMIVLAAPFTNAYGQTTPSPGHRFAPLARSRTHWAVKTITQTATQSSTAPTRDTQAVNLANQALSALTGGLPITDATVQASSSFIAGSDQQSGNATLEARIGYESRIALSLSGGQRTEVRNFSAAPPQGKWSGPDGTWDAIPLHNCWADPSWFFPALTIQSALNDPQISFVYIGQEIKAGIAVQHIQISRLIPGQIPAVTSLIQKLSQVDIYLDATSSLPVAIDFNTHPSNDAGRNLPVEIRFTAWHAAGSIQAPARIQQFMQGSLVLDLTVSGVTLNTGVSQSEFTI